MPPIAHEGAIKLWNGGDREQWRAHAAASGGEHLDYLHDYVASTAPRFGGLPFAVQLQLHTVLLRASHAPL